MAHRDIKPANLVVTKERRIVILDFNVSHKKPDSQEKFRMMTKTGTVAFSAPEIFIDKSYDEKVDVWSAGVVLYMMLTGSGPFDHEIMTQCVQNIT